MDRSIWEKVNRSPPPAPPVRVVQVGPPTAPAYCAGCVDLRQDIEDPRYRGRKNYNRYDLEYGRRRVAKVVDAAKRGCPGCKIVQWVLEPYLDRLGVAGTFITLNIGQYGVVSLDYILAETERPTTRVAQLEIRTVQNDSGIMDSGNDTAPKRKGTCPWLSIKPAGIISSYTGSVEAMDRASSWILDCIKNHPECQFQSPTYLPTRVLKIVAKNKVKLYSPDSEVGRYACLSHCWGGSSIIQTTTSSLQAHLNDIPWNGLPPTFQDAISFTHGLGLQYLWIDSLCIVQDSTDDWRQEGSKMSQIYANSFVTLAATSSSDPYSGLFCRPHPDHISRTRTFFTASDEPYEIHCRAPVNVIKKLPLLERGWVFQERLLSKRIVHFTEQELVWECMHTSTCECTGWHSKEALGSKPYFYKKTDGLSDANTIMELERRWEIIVSGYISKSLTYENDIFPALQGVTKLAPPAMGRYLAGHWQETLPHNLCWYVPPRDRKRKKVTKWRAPTWSWACGVGNVVWPLQRDHVSQDHATVVSARTFPKGVDATGELLYGKITLRGKCLAGRALFRSDSTSYPKLYLLQEGGQTRMQEDGSDSWWCQPYWDFPLEAIRKSLDLRILALRLAAGEVSDMGNRAEWQVWIILEAMESARGAKYERRGLIVLDPLTDRLKSTPMSLGVDRLNELCAVAAKEMEVTIV